MQLQIQNDKNFKLLLNNWRKEQQQQYLISYFDAYSKSGKLKEGLEILSLFRERGYWQLKNALEDVYLYNFFLKECAAKGHLENVKTLLRLMNQDSVKMTPESFAYIFECVARGKDPSKEIGTD